MATPEGMASELLSFLALRSWTVGIAVRRLDVPTRFATSPVVLTHCGEKVSYAVNDLYDVRAYVMKNASYAVAVAPQEVAIRTLKIFVSKNTVLKTVFLLIAIAHAFLQKK